MLHAAFNIPVVCLHLRIFDPGFTQCGLHAEDGRDLVPPNIGTGQGNMKPNGVFLVDGDPFDATPLDDPGSWSVRGPA
jgi:uncharacterized protein YigE (DUF2233 family)